MRTTAWMIATALLLGAPQLARADATAELWTALKAANDQNALAAIAKGVDVKKLDPAFGTPLNYAACFAGGEVIKALLDAKSEVNFVAPANGHTPLVNAAQWGNTEAVKLLLAAGGTVKGKTKNGSTFLSIALNGSKLEIVKMFVEAGADPAEKFRLTGLAEDLTLLNTMVSVYSPAEKLKNLAANAPNLAKLGITYPARLRDAKESDFTPLEETTKYLIEKGHLDPNQKVGGTWHCILNQAVDLRKAGVAQALLEAKANTETPITIVGKLSALKGTALMVAALNGDNAIAEMLLKAGAKVNAIGTQQTSKSESSGGTVHFTTFRSTDTATSLANSAGHPDTVALLRKYGGLGPNELK